MPRRGSVRPEQADHAFGQSGPPRRGQGGLRRRRMPEHRDVERHDHGLREKRGDDEGARAVRRNAPERRHVVELDDLGLRRVPREWVRRGRAGPVRANAREGLRLVEHDDQRVCEGGEDG